MSAIKNMSLFIPHVFPNFDQKYVSEAFAKVGDVDRVDFVAKQDHTGKPFNAVYIHFKSWYNNKHSIEIQQNIANNGNAEFYHDDKWFWLLLPNTAKKHLPGDRKPRIDLGESKSVSINTPEKSTKELVCPNTPKKLILKREEHAVRAIPDYASKLPFMDDDLESEIRDQMDEIEAELDEIEALMEADDENLISVDKRYIQEIEKENMWLRGEVFRLRESLISMDKLLSFVDIGKVFKTEA
jgi:hypothetical protein